MKPEQTKIIRPHENGDKFPPPEEGREREEPLFFPDFDEDTGDDLTIEDFITSFMDCVMVPEWPVLSRRLYSVARIA